MQRQDSGMHQTVQELVARLHECNELELLCVNQRGGSSADPANLHLLLQKIEVTAVDIPIAVHTRQLNVIFCCTLPFEAFPATAICTSAPVYGSYCISVALPYMSKRAITHRYRHNES